MTIDTDGLRAFIKTKDRSDPPYFAGRKDVIADIESVCRTMWQNHLAKAPQNKGMTRIIHGAPGAGKTSLIGQLERRWSRGVMTPAPRLLRLTGDAVISHAERFYRAVAHTINPDVAEKLYPRPGARIEGVGLNFFGFRVYLNFKRPDSSMTGPCTMGDLNRVIDHWDAPLVVSIDEAQNIGKADAATTRGILQEMHDNLDDLPVMLVLSGLGNTIDNAMELGLSRPAQGTTWTLGCFDPAETEDLIRGWGRCYGLPDGDWQTVMKTIAEDCDHFTLHVQNALMALAEEVVVADGQLGAVQPSAVQDRSRKYQLASYRIRMSPQMEKSAYLLGAVMRDLQEGQGLSDVIDSIEHHAGSRPCCGWQLPTGMDVGAYVRHLIHRGALQEYENGTVDCPIPSFRRFMIDQGERVGQEIDPAFYRYFPTERNHELRDE